MIDANHLAEYVIRPTLKPLGLWSEAAENLLLGTAAVESRMGTWLHQVGGGPALGIMQVEPRTHDDVWVNYLHYRPDEYQACRARVSAHQWDNVMRRPKADALMADLAYSVLIARYVYRRAKQALPQPHDWQALAAYWVLHYNAGGKGTTAKFIEACKACGVTNA